MVCGVLSRLRYAAREMRDVPIYFDLKKSEG
jgi:hypothetical protein